MVDPDADEHDRNAPRISDSGPGSASDDPVKDVPPPGVLEAHCNQMHDYHVGITTNI